MIILSSIRAVFHKNLLPSLTEYRYNEHSDSEMTNDIEAWKYLFDNEKPESVSKPKSETPIKNAEKRDGIYNTWLLILSDTLILRRTKADIVLSNGEITSLVALPEKKIDVVRVKLNKTEKFIYDKLFNE
jgi:hypothetical protein